MNKAFDIVNISYSHINMKQKDIKILIKDISEIDNNECYIQIFQFVVSNKIEYSTNEKGVFINSTHLSDAFLNQIRDFVM